MDENFDNFTNYLLADRVLNLKDLDEHCNGDVKYVGPKRPNARCFYDLRFFTRVSLYFKDTERFIKPRTVFSIFVAASGNRYLIILNEHDS